MEDETETKLKFSRNGRWNWTTFIYKHWKKCICDL